MGVGMAVRCIVGFGYGCDCGFGGFASLIAMVLALRAREALRSGLCGQGVFGALPFVATFVIAPEERGFARVGLAWRHKPHGSSCAMNAMSPHGRPVQHLVRPPPAPLVLKMCFAL